MAEVLIKGLEMSISGATFRVVEDLEGNKFLTSADCMNGLYYPIVEIPPHGRLIDADELERGLRQMAKYQTGERQQGILGCCETIRLAKTIIPAESEDANDKNSCML